MEEVTEEVAGLVARVAALDIGKAEQVASVRVPQEGKPGRRRQGVRTFATTTRPLLGLQDWLVCQGVSLCVMEATSTCWKPPFYLLEDVIKCWVVNARDVKNVPGRPKTGRLDAVWLAKLAERGMLRPSFVPPPWQRRSELCSCQAAWQQAIAPALCACTPAGYRVSSPVAVTGSARGGGGQCLGACPTGGGRQRAAPWCRCSTCCRRR